MSVGSVGSDGSDRSVTTEGTKGQKSQGLQVLSRETCKTGVNAARPPSLPSGTGRWFCVSKSNFSFRSVSCVRRRKSEGSGVCHSCHSFTVVVEQDFVAARTEPPPIPASRDNGIRLPD